MTHLCVALAMLAGPLLRPLAPPEDRPQGLHDVVKNGIERVVSKVLDAPTKVGDFKWDPDKQRLDLMDLRIGNPEGFSDDDAIFVKKVSLESDLKSLLSDQPEIRLIDVGSITVNAETALGKGNNLKKLMDNAKRIQPRGGKGLQGGLRGSGEEKRWKIEKATLDTSTVNISTALLSAQKQSHEFGPFEMSFIGDDGSGLPANQILARVMERLLQETNLGGVSESPIGGILGNILGSGGN
jgi:hypothetical protein